MWREAGEDPSRWVDPVALDQPLGGVPCRRGPRVGEGFTDDGPQSALLDDRSEVVHFGEAVRDAGDSVQEILGAQREARARIGPR